MTQNNNLSVLSFYPTLDEQAHRKPYAYGDIYPLFVPLGQLPPFQVICPSSNVQSVQLYNVDDTFEGNLGTSVVSTKSVSGGYVVYCHGGSSLYLNEGQYYIRLRVGSTYYYSDIFTAVGQISPFLKIEWWDDEDLVMDGATIVYSLGSGNYFKNRVYLNTQLGKPEYEFEEEGEKRDGVFFPEKMISEKTYKFNFLANEPLCDVMRLIRMSDHVVITDRYGNSYTADTFLMTPKWETQGNIASVDAEFQTNMVAKRIGRSYT